MLTQLTVSLCISGPPMTDTDLMLLYQISIYFYQDSFRAHAGVLTVIESAEEELQLILALVALADFR